MNNKTNVEVCQGENVCSDKINPPSDVTPVKTRQPCRNTRCQHHMFYEEIFKSNGLNDRRIHLIPRETDVSKGFFNCMNELDRPLTLEEVGEMYCITGKPTITMIVQQAIGKLKKQKKKLVGLREYWEEPR